MIRNSFYNLTYKVMHILFLLISSSYGSHIIHAYGIGKVASAQNIAQYFLLIACLGIPDYGTREIAKCRHNDQLKHIVFLELFIINTISSFLCFCFYVLFSSINGWFGDPKLYIIMGVSIILNIFNVDWLFQGEENYKYIAIRGFVVKVVSLVVLFFLVKDENGYCYYAVVIVLSLAGSYLINAISLLGRNINKPHFRNSALKPQRHLKTVGLLLCTTVSIELYTLLDTSMITYYCPPQNVGYYTMALRIPRVIIVAVTGISGVLLPTLSRYYKEGREEKCNVIINDMFSILLFLFIPCGIGLIVVARPLVSIVFGTSFLPGIATMRIAALLIFALGFSNLFGTQLLLTVGCEKKLLICTLAGAGTNIVLNSILIPRLAQNGAAVASVISEAIVTAMAVFFSKRYFRIRIDKRLLLISGVACLLMSITCLAVLRLIQAELAALLISITSGVFVYFGLNYCLKNPVIDCLLSLKNAHPQ